MEIVRRPSTPARVPAFGYPDAQPFCATRSALLLELRSSLARNGANRRSVRADHGRWKLSDHFDSTPRLDAAIGTLMEDWVEARLADLAAGGLLREPADSDLHSGDAPGAGGEWLDVCSNDYLGLGRAGVSR